jgi:biopolymer transport protein ExbD
MKRFVRQKKSNDTDTDIDMVPIMNMFLVLIPFLLSSASFFDINAIHTSVPVKQTNATQDKLQANKEKTVIPVIEMQANKIVLYALSEHLTAKDLSKWDMSFQKQGMDFPLTDIQTYLQDMKNQYPKSDTILVIPDDDILYETIIQTMDIARNATQTQLFPNVVLSDKI